MSLHVSLKPGMAIEIGPDVVVCISGSPKGYKISIEAPRELDISWRDQTKSEASRMRKKKSRDVLTSSTYIQKD